MKQSIKIIKSYLLHRHWMAPNIKSQCRIVSKPIAKEEIVTYRFHSTTSMSNHSLKQMLFRRTHIELQVWFAKSDFAGHCLEHEQLLHTCTVKCRSA